MKPKPWSGPELWYYCRICFLKKIKFEISNYLTFSTLFMDTGQQKPDEFPTCCSFNVNQNRWAWNSRLLLTGPEGNATYGATEGQVLYG